MSLAIEIDLVTQVLLVDGWHEVVEGSFLLDAYEYVSDGSTDGGLGGGDDELICATGFSFVDEANDRISGPLTSILAVKHGQSRGGDEA
jgi:hypothetical protein